MGHCLAGMDVSLDSNKQLYNRGMNSERINFLCAISRHLSSKYSHKMNHKDFNTHEKEMQQNFLFQSC